MKIKNPITTHASIIAKPFFCREDTVLLKSEKISDKELL